MVSTVVRLPPEQAAQLLARYREAVAAKRMRLALGAVLLAGAVVLAGIGGEVDLGTLAANAHRLPTYVWNLTPPLALATLGRDLAEWFWNLDGWLMLLGDTLLIAYLGTLFGALGAFVLCFAASANLEKRRWVRFLARRTLEFCRTVPELVFALLFVMAFGLGALPGVLALAIHTMGALGKLFAEVVENIDMKPVEGAIATGAGRLDGIRYAVLPQVLSNFASYALLRFEINVRGAAVMGFVGAGGIGQDLMVAIRKFYYTDVSAILLMIIVTVMIIDLVTERLRHHLIGLEQRP
ncbi:phosphonate ABC transporter, permease protein PhnE [Rhodoplanes serenus]|uniref:phosphonate ABC transporter, permease protein PhnE n=1 Tax=Rhodoplanes serenus TaxID=200615 RepID=UPI000DAE9D4F|nr:phosphonate ABC transporter, permease protein PhnE [Rhodoplanes serenus]RAI36796.1 phosphonate ABC transporter, permease protein PhnE [Rhodoplanes serenus]